MRTPTNDDHRQARAHRLVCTPLRARAAPRRGGALKFTALEAELIRPLIEHSPIMSWTYSAFGARTGSGLVGVFEIVIGTLIATRAWVPRISGVASLAASGVFVVTLSFLVTTPGAMDPTWVSGFIVKDL